jgi:hypothetical protein
MLSSWATSGTSSTSILTKCALGYCSENLFRRSLAVAAFFQERAEPEEGKGYILGDGRGNYFARTAPGCKGIKNDDLVVLESSVELSLTVAHKTRQYMEDADICRATHLAMLCTPILLLVFLKPRRKFLVLRAEVLIVIGPWVVIREFDFQT